MNKTIIIAEAGVNHNGSIGNAKLLIDAAVESGADYVKFQTFKAEKLVSSKAGMADYQKKNMGQADGTQIEMLKKLELSFNEFIELNTYCLSKNIKFLSTAFDEESVEFLVKLDMDFFKIPSGEITNLPYLQQIAKTMKPVVISTGMSDMDEISDAINVFLKHGYSKENISVLHCNTEYPTPMEDVNLKAMGVISKQFGVKVGYSDHTAGIEVPIAAVALGASVIEKHFTLDKKMEGPDHQASLEPQELKQMVQGIRNIEAALGQEVKAPTASESKNRAVARKSIVASRDICKGEVLSISNLTVKRPGTGLSPMMLPNIVGKVALKDFKEDDLIEI
jgi:N,N'-diacetyllegionaminate synthase